MPKTVKVQILKLRPLKVEAAISAFERIARTDIESFHGNADAFQDWLHDFCKDHAKRLRGDK